MSLTTSREPERRRTIGLLSAVAGYAALNLILFQGPLLGVILPAVDLGDPEGRLLFVSTQILQILLMCLILFLLSVISIRVMKVFMALNVVVNAAALYFMNTYGVVLDRTMIGNIVNTDQSEATQLWHPELGLYLIPALILAYVLLRYLRVRKPMFIARLTGFVSSLAVLLAWAFATPATWFWYDLHGENLGSRVLPWSYIVNAARYANQQALANREQILLPDATFDHEVPPGIKEVVILVIGEAARADHFSNYGYEKQTNPYTPRTDIVVMPMGKSCATYTIAALACMLTHEGNKASARTEFEPIQSYLTRHGVYTEYRTNNFGEPPLAVSNYVKAHEIAQDCKGPDCPDPSLDEALFWNIPQLIGQISGDRIFITLHETGSHGPAYYKKYPKQFERFEPVCDTVQVAKCSNRDLRNAYDNTLVYNDYLLARLVEDLDQMTDARIAMIYVSDHGQSLGENGLYLHGAPIAVAPDEQRLIPFYVWMSKSFKAHHGIDNDTIMRDEIEPHDLVFHSIMGAFGMKSDIYQAQRDLFARPESQP